MEVPSSKRDPPQVFGIHLVDPHVGIFRTYVECGLSWGRMFLSYRGLLVIPLQLSTSSNVRVVRLALAE